MDLVCFGSFRPRFLVDLIVKVEIFNSLIDISTFYTNICTRKCTNNLKLDTYLDYDRTSLHCLRRLCWHGEGCHCPPGGWPDGSLRPRHPICDIYASTGGVQEQAVQNIKSLQESD